MLKNPHWFPTAYKLSTSLLTFFDYLPFPATRCHRTHTTYFIITLPPAPPHAESAHRSCKDLLKCWNLPLSPFSLDCCLFLLFPRWMSFISVQALSICHILHLNTAVSVTALLPNESKSPLKTGPDSWYSLQKKA